MLYCSTFSSTQGEIFLENNTIDNACSIISERLGEIPRFAVVLGSGLGSLVDRIEDCKSISYSEIPGFPVSTAPGHASRLLSGTLCGNPLLVLQGRFHYYEGYSMQQVTYYVRCLKKLGCRTLLITNASGGINRSFKPGDFMLLTDHINLTGLNPLTGPNEKDSGPRFPDMSRAYSPELRQIAADAAAPLGISLKEGVYAWMIGPSFETPAEIRMLEILGADVVGMSTVPEVIAAVHAGIEVLSISLVSNMAAGVLEQPISAEEVMEAGKHAAADFSAFISNILALYCER